jgi:hypothetical protein
MSIRDLQEEVHCVTSCLWDHTMGFGKAVDPQ